MRTTRVQAAIFACVLALGAGACAQPVLPTISPAISPTRALPPTPSASTAADASPLTPEEVAGRLRTLDASLHLVATASPDDAGAFPELAFDAWTATPPSDLAPRVGLVLVYPTPAERAAMQPYFGWSGMSGPRASVIADGIVHSEWVAIDNVLVEVVMPGGTMGGRTPTPEENSYPERVRQALDGSS